MPSSASSSLSEVHVRHFRPADQKSVRALVLSGLGEHFGHINESLNPDLDDIDVHYTTAGHAFFVAECPGRGVVGTCGLLIEIGVAEIVRMSVEKSFRRHGVARLLLNFAAKEAGRRELRLLRAKTQPEWNDALSFYLAVGFRAVNYDEIDVQLELPMGVTEAFR